MLLGYAIAISSECIDVAGIILFSREAKHSRATDSSRIDEVSVRQGQFESQSNVPD